METSGKLRITARCEICGGEARSPIFIPQDGEQRRVCGSTCLAKLLGHDPKYFYSKTQTVCD